MKLRSLIITIFLLSAIIVRSQIPLSSPVYLLPSGNEKDGQPVFKVMTTKNSQFRKARQLFDRGFVNHVVTLYKMAQQYQVSNGKLTGVEEAYLAFTRNVGGFARIGFWLETPQGLVHKPNTGYVDLNENYLEHERDEIAAPPQIFNHEMGHLILNVLTLTPENAKEMKSPIMHYFTTLTDYTTAFDEGFAEHLQYMTVEFERNKKVKDTIASKVRRLNFDLSRTMYGYERDYNWSLRMGFFAATMPAWYQSIENIRRHSFIRNNWAKMPARVASGINNPADYIQYRNAAVWPNPAVMRSYAESMSVEGILATFFSHVITNDMNKNFMVPEAYRVFIPDTSVKVPQQIDVTTNQYLKMFIAIAGSTQSGPNPGGPFTAFMKTYLQMFPTESSYIKSCWETSSEHQYNDNPAPEVWVMNTNFHVRPYAMGPFGPTIPTYTFNLNVADTIDLMTFDKISRSDAEKIITWRNQNQGFKTLSEVEKTPDVDADKLKEISQAIYDPQKAEKLFNKQVPLTSFFIYPIIHLLKMSLLWFIILGVLYAMILVFYAKITPSPRLLTLLLLKVLMFATAGLIIQILMIKQFALMLGFTLLLLAISYLANRRKGTILWLSLGSTLAIGIVMLYSLW